MKCFGVFLTLNLVLAAPVSKTNSYDPIRVQKRKQDVGETSSSYGKGTVKAKPVVPRSFEMQQKFYDESRRDFYEGLNE